MLKVLSGNKAAAYAAKLARIEVAAVYPITPQSQIGEDVSKFVADGELDCSIIEVEGEPLRYERDNRSRSSRFACVYSYFVSRPGIYDRANDVCRRYARANGNGRRHT